MSDLNRKDQLAKIQMFWTARNPQHDLNAESGEDMFWGTVLAIFKDMQQANGVDKSTEQALPIRDVVGSYSEKDMDNAYDKGFADAMKKYRTDL